LENQLPRRVDETLRESDVAYFVFEQASGLNAAVRADANGHHDPAARGGVSRAADEAGLGLVVYGR
jgi:hypothetical protein